MFGQSKLKVICIVTAFGLSACGGGGGGGGGSSVTGPSYSGTTTAVVLDSTNAQTVESDASTVAGDIINSQGASAPFGAVVQKTDVPTTDQTNLVVSIVHKAMEQSQGSILPAGATLTYVDLNNQLGSNEFCGGSITYPDNIDPNSPTLDITMTFNNLCFDGGGTYPQVTMNGTVRLIETDTYYTVIFSNVTMTMGADTFTLNASTTCDSFGDCTVDFVGSDGNTYRVGSMSVSGDNSTGYYYSATFYHPDFGSVSVTTTTPITFNCAPAVQPDSGELAFVGDGGTSGRIVFAGCTDYTYCVDEGMGEACNSGTW